MTKTVLHIDSAARYEDSVSRALSHKTVAALDADKVIYRDVAAGIPLIDEAWVTGRVTPAQERSPEEVKSLEYSEGLIAELKEAQTIVIGVPTYNFALPASLKLWIDQIARPGETFFYNEQGQPVGMLEGKKAIVVLTSGGVPAGSPADFVTDYLKFVLGFIGIQDVVFVNADRTMARPDILAESDLMIAEAIA